MCLSLPRASAHLVALGQLLSDAAEDTDLAATLASVCIEDAAKGLPCDPGSFRGFLSFLATHVSSGSSTDRIKADILYIALELLDCCLVTTMAQSSAVQQASVVLLCLVHRAVKYAI